jgi:hypothetical protein
LLIGSASRMLSSHQGANASPSTITIVKMLPLEAPMNASRRSQVRSKTFRPWCWSYSPPTMAMGLPSSGKDQHVERGSLGAPGRSQPPPGELDLLLLNAGSSATASGKPGRAGRSARGLPYIFTVSERSRYSLLAYRSGGITVRRSICTDNFPGRHCRRYRSRPVAYQPGSGCQQPLPITTAF